MNSTIMSTSKTTIYERGLTAIVVTTTAQRDVEGVNFNEVSVTFFAELAVGVERRSWYVYNP